MGTRLTTQVDVPLAELAEQWMTALEAGGKSAMTIRAYKAGVTGFLRWHANTGPAEPVLDKEAASLFLRDLRRAGQSPGTCRLRHAALRRFATWMAEEGVTERDELVGLKPPALDHPVVPRLTDAELAALIKACKGTTFTDRRDEALVRLITEGLLRAGEALALTAGDVDVRRGIATVRRGKGGKGRVVPFGPQTATAINRYLNLRRRHLLAHTAPMWLPGGGRATFGYQGLAAALGARAKAAGIEGFHLHRLRHTGASRWLRAGGSEGGLMAAGGWADRNMIDRYAGDTAAERAVEEARRLNLGQF